MKKYLIPCLYTLSILLLGSFLSSIIYYFNLTSDKFNTILLYLIGIMSIFVGSLKLSKNLNQKGIITGVIYFGIFVVIMIFTSVVIFKSELNIKSFIYYFVLLIFSMLGGVLGKNMQEEKEAN